MANIVYRFDNTPFGGNQNVSLSEDEMPDYYPIGQDAKRNQIVSDSGRAWTYTWYRKELDSINFQGVGTALVATMGSIVSEDVAFLFYKDTSTP